MNQNYHVHVLSTVLSYNDALQIEMGENAKKRFQDLATKFKKNLNQNQTNRNLNSGGSFGAGGGAAERRGLLDIHDDDDDEQEISFVGGGGAEMRTMDAGFAFNKKDD
jgi:hypothetical protein